MLHSDAGFDDSRLSEWCHLIHGSLHLLRNWFGLNKLDSHGICDGEKVCIREMEISGAHEDI